MMDFKTKNIREKLLYAMKIKTNLRNKNKNQIYKILLKKIHKIKNIIHEFEIKREVDKSYLYEFSKRQNVTKDLAYTQIKNQKEFIDGYYNIIDFIDDYGDRHEGKIFLQ